MRKAVIAIVIILALVVTALVLQGLQRQPNAPDTIKIGWIGPLSGDVSTIGIANKEGAELAVNAINEAGGVGGRKLVLVAEDDQYNSKISVNAFRKLIEVDSVDAVLMVTYGGIKSVSPIADAMKIITIDSLDASDEIASAGDYVFGIGIYDDGVGRIMAEYAYKIGKRRAGIIFLLDDPYPVLVKKGFLNRFKELGGSAAAEPYSFGETDFRSRLVKIKDSNPDILVVVGYDEAGLAFRQARELGLNITFISADTLTSEGFRRNAGDSAEGAYFPFWEAAQTEKYLKFRKDYVENYGKEPVLELYSVTGYDSVLALQAALENSISADFVNRESLRNNMYELKNISGVAGRINMDADGIVRTIELSMYQLKNSTFAKI